MTLANKVTQLTQNADKLNQVIHGDANTVVQTDGGPVRSLAKLLADNQATLNSQATLRTDLAASTGAALIGVTGGGTLQAKLNGLEGQVASAGGVKSVNGVAPSESGDIALTTDSIQESSTNPNNLWFNAARVRNTIIGSYLTFLGTISSTDSLITALGKLQAQVSNLYALKIGYTSGKVAFLNALGTITSYFANSNTAPRTYTLPDKDGTFAMISDVQAGAMVLLGQATVSAAVANIDFLNIFSAGYDNYVVFADGVKPSATDTLQLRLANSGVVDAGSPGIYNGMGGDSATFTAGNQFPLSPAGSTNTSTATLAIEIMNANSTAEKVVTARGMHGSAAVVRAGKYQNAANGVSGFRLFWAAASNFTAGTVRVYGIKNS